MKIIGIDLAALEKNPSGVCIVLQINATTFQVVTFLMYSDPEIISLVGNEMPDVVAIDAPLSMPKKGAAREIYKIMRQRGMHAFPELFGFMKQLTKRGINIAKTIKERLGVKVIEIHPRSSLFNMNVSKKEVSLNVLRATSINKDELDAFVAALTGLAYLIGEYDELSGIDGNIFFPTKEFYKKIKKYKFIYVNR